MSLRITTVMCPVVQMWVLKMHTNAVVELHMWCTHTRCIIGEWNYNSIEMMHIHCLKNHGVNNENMVQECTLYTQAQQIYFCMEKKCVLHIYYDHPSTLPWQVS